MVKQAAGVELKVSVVAQTANEISLRYDLKNDRDAPIHVFDQQMYFDSKVVVKHDENGAYIFLDDDHSVRLVRGIISPPFFMSVLARPPIVVSTLESGKERSGIIKLILPATEANLFFPPKPCDPKTVKLVDKLKLQIGWVEHREKMAFREIQVDGKPFKNISGAWGAPIQYVAEKEISVKAVGICPYPERFDRPLLNQ